MQKDDFLEIFPNIDNNILWYLQEIVYCLEHYAGKQQGHSFTAVITSENFMLIMNDDPAYIAHENPFYWAMCIAYGFNTPWWQNKELWDQHNEYVKERHRPPASAN